VATLPVYVRVLRIDAAGAAPVKTLSVNYLAIVTGSPAPYFTLNYDHATADSLVTAGDCAGCTPLATPATPTVTTPSANTIQVTWPAIAGAQYNIYRVVGLPACPAGGYVKLNGAPLGTNSYTDGGLVAGTTSSYRITSINPLDANCESVMSGCASGVATACTNPGAPVLTAPLNTSVNNDITLNWTAGVPNGTSFKIYRTAGAACGAGRVAIASGLANTTTTYTDSGIPGGTVYSYEVAAVNGTCETLSNCVTGTATGGPNQWSRGKNCSSRPEDTTTATLAPRWIYSTGAASLVPPGVGSVYAVSNDRVLHGVTGGAGGGLWGASWKPMLMNAPAQARPPVTTFTIGSTTKEVLIGTQDGYARLVDANTGVEVWRTALGDMVQGAVTAIFTMYGGSYDLIVAGTRNSATPNVVYGLNPTTGAVGWSFNNGGGATAIGIITGDIWLDYRSVNPLKNKMYFATRARTGGSSGTVWCLDYTNTTAALCSEPGSVWPAAVGDIDGSVTLFRGRLYVGTDSGSVIALNPMTGQTIWSTALGDGPIKGYVETDWNKSATPYKLFVATTNRVTILTDNGASATVDFNVTVPGPSVPLFTGTQLLVGGSDGRLYELSNVTLGAPTSKSVLLGTGLAAVGDPTNDWLGALTVVGTDNGKIYAVKTPLP
jgi:outer membrane protein assembly factor BamB